MGLVSARWRRTLVALAVVGLCAVPTAAEAAPPAGGAAEAATAPGMGELRVTTSPAVASLISVDGVPRDVWGLTWLDIAAGSHEVCFSDVAGYTTPACETVAVPEGGTGSLAGAFTALTPLQVTTAPAVPSTITVRDVTAAGPTVPRDDWGVFSWVPAGHEIEVCFGPVAGYTPPGCQIVPAAQVVAGQLVAVTGTFAVDAEAVGPSGTGSLRVTTSPAVPSSISVDGVRRDDWGLDWLQLAPGNHEVCFSDVLGLTTPPCQTVAVTAGETTTVQGTFDPQGWVKVTTDPPSEATISVDGTARNDWGAWFPIEPATHQICFESDGTGPACRDIAVSAGETAEVSNAAAVATIDAGTTHACAVKADHSVACWGNNVNGKLGIGDSGGYYSSPVAVSGITNAVEVSAGGGHSCALLDDATVRCWGGNFFGALGNGTTNNSSVPVQVTGISTAISVVAAGSHSCALLAGGSVSCWGSGLFGALGNGATADSSLPVAVSGISTATSISAGEGHTCARLADGTARCWGHNAGGKLGDGTTTSRSVPVAVTGLSDVASLGAGAGHTCAVLASGGARCWGANTVGQLGDGTTTSSPVPVTVTGVTTATSISGGGYHSCAVLADGTDRCWGYNVYGQLGNGTTSNSPVPVTVSSLTSSSAVTLGGDFSCAIDGGHALCWGIGGLLGDGTEDARSEPVPVVGL